MNRLPSSPMPWVLGAMATAAAALLLFSYVNLLQEAVARGHQSQYAQQESPHVPPAKAVSLGTRGP